MNERKSIPRQIKDIVRMRQRGGCAACMNRGEEYHHVLPVSLGGNNDSKNIVLLCRNHHNLLHLGDLETCLTILEYIYFLKNGQLPFDINEIKEIGEKIKKEHILLKNIKRNNKF
jgi:hypothetical protein